MRKTRADSVLGSLPVEKQEALFERVSSLSITEGLALVTEPETKGGFGVKVGRSSFADWLGKERVHRFGERLRKGGEAIDQLANKAKGAEKYDPVVFAAVREILFSQLAAGEIAVDDVQKLAGLLLADRRLEFDKQKLESAERFGGQNLKLKEGQLKVAQRRVAVLEQRLEKAKDTLTDETLTDEQRVKKMRGIFSLHG